MKTAHKAGITGAGAIAIALAFTPGWEGLWTTAQVDHVGTGQPVTYCYGQTSENGAVHVGQKFTPEQCKDFLAKSLPLYLSKINQCIKVDIPDKSRAALLDAAYNAGTVAVCKSPMIAKMNAGDLKGGCEAFNGWYIRARGKVVQGLINRRSGDTRKGEKELCLEGIVTPEPSRWAQLLSHFKRN